MEQDRARDKEEDAGSAAQRLPFSSPALHDQAATFTPPMQARQGLLASTGSFSNPKRQSLGVAARFSSTFHGTPGGSDFASPLVNARVREALKEITASPSPKVSTLVEQIRENLARQDEAAESHAQLQLRRSEMLAESAKVRAMRKKRVDVAERELELAKNATVASERRLRQSMEQAQAARHSYNELLAKPGTNPLAVEEAKVAADKEEALLKEAHLLHKTRVEEEHRAKVAADAALAEHQDAVRSEEQFLSEAAAEDAEFERKMGMSPGQTETV
eukprot:CAMPEP_0181302394 /NCGR_PEP_ID=MMETSP1101-20121128/7978_1 /TAXON_ID=46948 /ORGANISM="Rhodomonas abbreviata, Strain Caron Lab Isolate" /LENGTH=274 /DNA_ID=CAMNT_0023407851 /DNA_START=300 /DNA_END=1121 /DNA_ORIENTATION=-